MPISVSRVSTLGASLVCRVVSTRWPVRAPSIAICAVSVVADLTDQDDVWVGTAGWSRLPRRSDPPWGSPAPG